MSKLGFSILIVFAVIFSFNIAFVSCNYKAPEPAYKSDTLLPPITTVGAKTFGCKLNGSFWYPSPKVTHSAVYNEGSISINCKREGNYNWGSVYLQSSDNQILGPGRYYFNKEIKGKFISSGGMYETPDSFAVGFIDILRLDSVNGIISGTFEFSPTNSRINPSKVYFTEGRFDLKI